MARPGQGLSDRSPGARPARWRGEGVLLAVILLVAVLVRVYGIQWALPDRWDLNPDEQTVLEVAGRLSGENWDPGVYFYSGFSFHLIALVQWLGRVLRPGLSEAAQIVLARLISVAFGTATVGVLFALLRRLSPPGPAALVGAAALALMPLHVWDSHYATTDVTLVCWMLAVVLASVWAYERPTFARFAGASFLLGVAAGVKFNGAMVGPAVGIAGLLAVWEGRLRLVRLVRWGAGGVATAVFALFLASPHTFLAWQKTWGAFQHEMDRVHWLDYGFNLGAPGWQYKPYVYQFGAAFPFSFGIALYLAVVGGLVYCALRLRRRALLIPFGYAAIYLGVMGSWDFVPIRYYLPIHPVLLMAAALGLAAGLTAPAVRTRRLAGAALVLVLGYTAAFTLSTTSRFTDDTRMQAQRWLNERVRESKTVLTVGAVWYLPRPTAAPSRVLNLNLYGVMVGEIEQRRPDYVVLTGLHYLRSYRQQDANVRLWDTVRRGVLPYRLVERFQAHYLNWRFYRKLDPMYEGYFISPTIEVYERQP